MDTAEMVQAMCQSILDKCYKMIKKEVGADKTFTAKVIEITNVNKCRILYCGVTYTVSTTVPVEVGNIVRVCAPSNNWLDLFVIENKTKNIR